MTVATPDADYAVLTDSDTVRLERLLPGPPERVWRYLTDSDLRRQWLAAGTMTPDTGTDFELVWRNDELTDPPGHKPEGFGEEHRMRSTITAFEPGRRLAFTWGAGEVRFDLEPRGNDVLLTITHTGISDRRNVLMIGAGWHMHVNVMAARLAGSRSEPFWDGWSRLRDEYDRRIPA
jgi:uncharacterized protein YndB with AHSA1/START domain